MSDSFREAYDRVRHYLGLDPDDAYDDDRLADGYRPDVGVDPGSHVRLVREGDDENAAAEAPRPLTPPAAPSAAAPDDDEHRAVLEVLVATMYADANVTEQELEEIDGYGDAHGWNTPTFSFVQGMAAATAKVRDARAADGGLDALLADAAARITTPEVRTTLAASCRIVAQADGTTAETESDWISRVAATFGG